MNDYTSKGYIKGKEPTKEMIENYMKAYDENYYNSREYLREFAYGGKPPHPFHSWGDYWKAY